MNSRSDRGAILVHVAISLLALITFSAFTIDYGVFYVARGQAQNAADAGALSGAIARIYDDTSSPPSSISSGVVYENVVGAVAANRIWGVSTPGNAVTMDWNCPSGSTDCVHVDVYRDGTNNSTPLSTFFLRLAGVNTQGVRAHAIAEVRGANATGCMRPWFLIDRYTDVNGNDRYDGGDVYSGPGYRVPDDIGTQVLFHANMSPSGYGQVDVGSGTADLNEAIRFCASGRYQIGQTVGTKPGGSNGQKHGVADVLAWDPNATFNVSTGRVENSCAPSCGCDGGNCAYGGRISPRVMIIPVCSPTQADCRDGGPNNGEITITNFLSFFLDSYEEHHTIIHATLMGTGGEIVSGGAPPANGTFLKAPVLVR
jgi:hypothetical protein